jgi:hypothetical protein
MNDRFELNRSGYAIMSALLGGMLWIVLAITVPFGNAHLDLIELLLLLAVLVFVPLGFDLAATPDREGWNRGLYRFARFAQPLASVAAVGSFFLPPGPVAGGLAVIWFLFATLVALFGATRLLRRRSLAIEELCIDAGLVYIAVGGAWLTAARLGLAPLGFGGVIALLTAVHFHFAGFIAPIVAGLAGRYLARVRPSSMRLYRVAAVGIMAGPILVALGITLSPAVEVISAIILATSLTLFAGLSLFTIRPSLIDRRARFFLAISALASVVAMLFALLYALGSFLERSFVSIPEMAIVHGCVNALFALGALLCWGIVRPAPERPAADLHR